MKIVINADYGGFSIPDEIVEAIGADGWFDRRPQIRTNPIFVKHVEDNANERGMYHDLKVVEIPDEATDWDIYDYDGLETLFYVLDGKIFSVW